MSVLSVFRLRRTRSVRRTVVGDLVLCGVFLSLAGRTETVELLPQLANAPYVFASEPNVFAGKPDCKSVSYAVKGADLPDYGRAAADVVLPFAEMRYFDHWGLKPVAPDAKPEAKLLTSVHFCFGKWLCEGTLKKPHGFEVKSVRLVKLPPEALVEPKDNSPVYVERRRAGHERRICPAGRSARPGAVLPIKGLGCPCCAFSTLCRGKCFLSVRNERGRL